MMTDKSNIIRLFGFSLNPEINKYALVIDYEKIKFLEQHLKENILDWSEKYRIIIKIVTILKNIYEKVSLDYFNPRNILIDEMDHVKISSFTGFGRENNIAYTAPEMLQGSKRENDQSSN